jgi:hypothetical protein
MKDYISLSFAICQGLPQGSPLSIILYIIYKSSMLTPNFSLKADQISKGYMDDLVHLAASKSPAECQRALESLGSKSLIWGTRYGAIFDQKKAQFMWIYPKAHPTAPLKFGGQELTPEKEVKWLGIWLDPKLNLNKQLAEIEKKAAQTLAQLQQLGNSRWGLPEPERAKLSKAVLIPRICYGAALWAIKTKRRKLVLLTDKIDNQAAIYLLGVFKSSPIKWNTKRSPLPRAMEFFVKTAFAFFSCKFSVHSMHQSLWDAILTDLQEGNPKHQKCTQQSLSSNLLREYISHSPENITIFHQTEPLSTNHPIVFHNMNLKKKAAEARTRDIIAEGKQAPGNALIYTNGSYDQTNVGMRMLAP